MCLWKTCFQVKLVEGRQLLVLFVFGYFVIMSEMNNFKLVYSSNASESAAVRKYRSSKSGISVVIADVGGPLVSGFFVLATEAHDDDGLPHTLEHLIFIGSEKYPYKGVLDLLANRNLASGTNAWTDTDHTCYTITTAGSEGFLNLLPVYIDHILYPTLTDVAFTTEVHHIDGDGQDAGIVYCEMQGRENTGESRVFLELLRSAYPGHCGYKSETGGIMKNLRESTTNMKVKDYHKKYYRSDNLTLIIIGHINDEDVIKALAEVEEKSELSSLPAFERPWQSPVPPIPKPVDQMVLYPSDEEDNGMVYLAWQGPSAVKQLYELSACALLLRYLTDTSISPLQKEFVEVADPLASSVRYYIQENSVSLLNISFENVPITKLSEVKPRLTAKLREISSGTESIDMERMKTLINRQRLELLLNLETQPHNTIAFMVIGDVLYGETEEQFHQRLNPIKDLDKMSEEKVDFWIGLLDRYLINAPSVTVRGKPSLEEKEAVANNERKRVNEQIESLGPEGLKKKADELEKATKLNEIPPPNEMLVSSPLPDPARINFHKVETYSSESESAPKHFEILDIPQFAHVDDMDSKFVYLMVQMDTSQVPDNLRPYIPLYLEAILESPILRDGKIVPYDAVIKELEQDTIAARTSLGIYSDDRFACGPFGQVAALTIQVEIPKYERGVRWLHEILYCTQFTAERLSIIAAKAINEVAEFRRRGSKISWDLLWSIFFISDCNLNVNNMIRQHKFLSDLGKSLTEGGESAISDMEKLRKMMTAPSNITVRLSAKLDSLSSHCANIALPWSTLLPADIKPVRQKLKVTHDSILLKSKLPEPGIWILGLGSNESNYLCQTIPSINDVKHEDLPALLVFVQFLTQLEGPMWKQIRGRGLAYGYHVEPRSNQGLLHLSFYKSTNVAASYTEAKEIVQSYLESKTEVDPTLLDSAKCSLMFKIISKEDTIMHMVRQSVLSYFNETDADHNRELVRKVAEITAEEMLKSGRKYMSTLFEPSKARLTLVCPASKVEELATSFSQFGFKVTDCKSMNDHFLSM